MSETPHEIPGIVVTTIDGRLTALNQRGPDFDVICPVCTAHPDRQPDCAECAGRGHVTHVPYCARGWDEVVPGLFVGGHQCQPGNGEPGTVGDVYAREEFDLVVSLYRGGPQHGPGPGVEHLRHKMPDGPLDERDYEHVRRLADTVADRVMRGKTVLVRCQAGINRAALVAALAMTFMGWTPEAAIARIREVRSPYVLFNASFVDFLMNQSVDQ